MGITKEGSLQGVPQNNAVAERNNRDILDGARVALIHAGLPTVFWPFAGPCYCVLTNTDMYDSSGTLLADGSPWCRRHGEEFKGLRLPFGTEVIFLPANTKSDIDVRKWDGTGHPGVFAGYKIEPGYVWGGGLFGLVVRRNDQG